MGARSPESLRDVLELNRSPTVEASRGGFGSLSLLKQIIASKVFVAGGGVGDEPTVLDFELLVVWLGLGVRPRCVVSEVNAFSSFRRKHGGWRLGWW